MYLLDVAQGEGISTVDVDGFSNLPEGAVLLRLTQTGDSGERAQLAYEIARDGSHRRLSPQERSFSPTKPEKAWRGQDAESFAGVWYPFATPNDPEWLELRRHLDRDPLDPLLALEPILDAVAPSESLRASQGSRRSTLRTLGQIARRRLPPKQPSDGPPLTRAVDQTDNTTP
jgi:hypothetical protein